MIVSCFFVLVQIITALMLARILSMFVAQIIGLLIYRRVHPDAPRPFRMWLYPLPAILASAGFVFILFSRPNFLREIRYAVVILTLGLLIFMIRAWRNGEWPFAQPQLATDEAPGN